MHVQITEEDLFAATDRRSLARNRLPRCPRVDDPLRNFDVGGSPGDLMHASTSDCHRRHTEDETRNQDAAPSAHASVRRTQGVYQMGEVQARSWMTGSCPGLQQASKPDVIVDGSLQFTPASTHRC